MLIDYAVKGIRMNEKWAAIFLLVIWGVGCKGFKPPKNDVTEKEFLSVKTINENELKKFIRNYPVILWKKKEIKENEEMKSEEKQTKVNNFIKELGYTSADEFNRIWMTLSTIQGQLNYKEGLKKRIALLNISKEEKKKIEEELRIINELLKNGFVREDLPVVDINLIEKYYQELKKLKITDLINGS